MFDQNWREGQPESFSIDYLRKAYTRKEPGGRLLLPTIQRSLVWDNARIINYWDTLRRGWYPGMMMVRELEAGTSVYEVGTENTEITESEKGDFELFDGQQRMAAIMLGFGEGQLSASRKIWVGFSAGDEVSEGNIKFRISSKGQPFGYRLNEPNKKEELHKRRDALVKMSGDKIQPSELMATQRSAFEKVSGTDLIGGDQWWPLSDVLAGMTDVPAEVATVLGAFAERVRSTHVLVRKVLNAELDEYGEFFRRIGQGGVALSDTELTFSLINREIPQLRPLMESMAADSRIGRLMSPTDLALGLLRLARIVTSKAEDQPWARVNRPNPDYVVSQHLAAKDSAQQLALTRFKEWLTNDSGETGFVRDLLIEVRRLLSEKPSSKGQVSPILLARLPRGVIEIAMMLCHHDKLKNFPQSVKSAFCSWAIFFADADQVAFQLAAEASSERDVLPSDFFKKFIEQFENEGKSDSVPTLSELSRLRSNISAAKSEIRNISEWFTLTHEGKSKTFAILNSLMFWSPKGKNILLWLQSEYLNRDFPDFDPTSEADEDLPVDLDHIVGGAWFAFQWDSSPGKAKAPKGMPDEVREEFRWQRKDLGNLAGNLRWLCASLNRGRGKGGSKSDEEKDPLYGEDDLTSDFEQAFDRLLARLGGNGGLSGWSTEDYYLWQSTVLERTLALLERFLIESGVVELVPG